MVSGKYIFSEGMLMNELSAIIKKNQQMWEEEVASGEHYTIPDFDLDVDLLKQFADGELLGWCEKKQEQ